MDFLDSFLTVLTFLDFIIVVLMLQPQLPIMTMLIIKLGSLHIEISQNQVLVYYTLMLYCTQ